MNAVVDGVQLAPNLEDIMSALLCRKKSGAPYFDIKCIQGLCPACKPGLSVISNLELDDEAISHLKPEKKSVTHSVYDLRHTFTPDQIKERENAGVKTSKSRVRVKMTETETPPELLNRFGKAIEMYGLHKFLATWQNKCTRNIDITLISSVNGTLQKTMHSFIKPSFNRNTGDESKYLCLFR